MNADIAPKDAIERVRERGDVIKWEDSGHTFVVRRPDNFDGVVHEFLVERYHNGECYPHGRIDPLSLWNVLSNRYFKVVPKTEIKEGQ